MSDNQPAPHLHLLSSFESGWDGLNLIYELEPADEMPETDLEHHFIIIAENDFRASFMFNGSWQEVDYARGDIAIIPATETFPRTFVDREVPLIELFLAPAMLARAAFDSVDADKIELVPQLHLCDPLIQHMGLALKQELAAGGADSRLYAESMGTALAVHLLRRYCSFTPQIKNYTGGLSKYQLQQVFNYIEQNLDGNLSLENMSSAVQISPHYFATLFKQSTGVTPHQYVIKCRIDRAKQLLGRRELTLVEICLAVGFQSQSHFTRVFRQQVKTTPKAYRNDLAGTPIDEAKF
ncbi:AraC family transcriptional regulator [Microcoleus sp. bin38.metabat.b11b12b14.051]|uniref:helix-turn-helix transcriptional regulator n=1 Tax=Microcoleus sp. bin38.metabat.b11b12b14.051 TaxID=2742709 RepID=UPI0025FF2E73|nr:AraC family transcriptional regulator [Microcoleus sp. bin38.metabat.b11b12b14.051]